MKMWGSMIAFAFLAVAAVAFPSGDIPEAFGGREGALVVLDGAGEPLVRHNEDGCREKLPPCSTFKIWNTAIGLETGILSDPDAPFWKWDGKKYWLDAWNRDLTLREAFAVSCVPGYQELARQIGRERMDEYLEKLGYGNGDTSSGLDVFWLPEPGRKALVISPEEQAQLLARLVRGDVPFSPHTRAVLKDVMKVEETERGTLYGKTGSSGDNAGFPAVGWFVGYVESADGTSYPFACVLRGDGITGRDARAVVEKVFSEAGLL